MQTEQVKELEEKQEEWIERLIKPQELNQARLFSIDSRIKEGEQQRAKDQQFQRDVLKKFIYAVEQATVTKGKAEKETVMTKINSERSHYGANSGSVTRPDTHRTRSIADQNFGTLPGLPASENTTHRESARQQASFMDMKSTMSGPGQNQTTGDILFLKRLLFLKASLDNETAISSSQAIRLDGDKIFDVE